MRPRTLAVASALLLLAAPVEAQTGPYPAFQPIRTAEREYNFVVSDFSGGTALVAQWREGLDNSRLQFTGDIGMADAGSDAAFILGGSLHLQITRANSELPFDMVLGGGMGVILINDANAFQIPIGVAIGHRFPLEGSYAISPFVHPRLVISSVEGNSDTSLDVDIGGSFEINSQMQVRLAASLGDSDAVGISFAWLPRGLRR